MKKTIAVMMMSILVLTAMTGCFSTADPSAIITDILTPPAPMVDSGKNELSGRVELVVYMVDTPPPEQVAVEAAEVLAVQPIADADTLISLAPVALNILQTLPEDQRQQILSLAMDYLSKQ